MKRALLTCAAVVVGTWIAAASAFALTVDDCVKMAKAGVSDEVIMTTVKASGSKFKITSVEADALRKKGLSKKLIDAMAATSGGIVVVAPVKKTAEEIERDKREGDRQKRIEEQERREAEAKLTPEEKARREREEAARKKAEEDAAKAEADKRAADEKVQAEARSREERLAPYVRGKALLEGGKYWAAAESLYDFTQNADSKSAEAGDAEFRVGLALARAGYYPAAVDFLLNTASRGPADPNFSAALRWLHKSAKSVEYFSPLFEKLTRFDAAQIPDGVKNDYNYFVGKFYYKWGNLKRAEKYLELVTPAAPSYADARYFLGLIGVRDKRFKTAHDRFKTAVKVLEARSSRDSDARQLLDVTFLALGRLAYEVGQNEAALFFYERISTESTKLPRALFEKAWTYFVMGDIDRAIGMFHSLHSPYFSNRYFPELYIMEATVYLNLCRVKMARELAEAFAKRNQSLAKGFKEYVGKKQSPASAFNGFMEASAGRGDMPKELYQFLLDDEEFTGMVNAVKEYDRELKSLGYAAGEKPTGFGAKVLNDTKERRRRVVNSAGLMVQKKVQEADAELADLLVKADEVTFDAINAEKDELDADTKALMQGGKMTGKAIERIEKPSVSLSYMYWDFDGEYWEDEVGWFRSMLRDACKKEE